MNDDLALYVLDRGWVPAGALAIGIVVRLLKSDTILPTLPAKWRLVLVGVLSIGLVALNKIAAGMPWPKAIEYAVLSALIAVAAHELLIERLRDGKEIPLPLLTKKEDPPPPPTDTPPSSTPPTNQPS